MRLKKVIILIIVLINQTSYTHANQSISIGYEAKYRNFDSFDYVDSGAIKAEASLFLLSARLIH